MRIQYNDSAANPRNLTQSVGAHLPGFVFVFLSYRFDNYNVSDFQHISRLFRARTRPVLFIKSACPAHFLQR